MRAYQIWLTGGRFIELQADDANVNAAGSKEFWLFTVGPVDQDAATVGGFPYDSVEYVVALEQLVGGNMLPVTEGKNENQTAASDQLPHPSGLGIIARRKFLRNRAR